MAAIIPRQEWRAFAAEDAFAALTSGPVQESDELYLLPRPTRTSWSATA